MTNTEYIETYLGETRQVVDTIDRGAISDAIDVLKAARSGGGRLFILGVGGSAANSSHAVNDFRKIGGMEAYAPTDNVSELTAWTNDNGFEYVFVNWLKTSKLRKGDVLLVLSVGGGSAKVSRNLVLAMEHAKQAGARIVSIVSRNGGVARELSDACVLVPVIANERITPHAEGWQGVVWHLIVNAMGDS